MSYFERDMGGQKNMSQEEGTHQMLRNSWYDDSSEYASIQDAFVLRKTKETQTYALTFHFKFSIVCAKRSLITTMAGAATISIYKKSSNSNGRYKTNEGWKRFQGHQGSDLFSLPSMLPGGE
jgi:hypothetical protein